MAAVLKCSCMAIKLNNVDDFCVQWTAKEPQPILLKAYHLMRILIKHVKWTYHSCILTQTNVHKLSATNRN